MFGEWKRSKWVVYPLIITSTHETYTKPSTIIWNGKFADPFIKTYLFSRILFYISISCSVMVQLKRDQWNSPPWGFIYWKRHLCNISMLQSNILLTRRSCCIVCYFNYMQQYKWNVESLFRVNGVHILFELTIYFVFVFILLFWA